MDFLTTQLPLLLLLVNMCAALTDPSAIRNRRNTRRNVKRLKVAHWYLFPYRRAGIDARLYDEAGNPYNEKKPRPDHGFTYRFPNPPIKTFSLDVGVMKHCKGHRSVGRCLDYIYATLKTAKSQKGDVLIGSNDDFTPFQDRFERFQFQSTALYYMCWHTLKRDPILKFFGFNCGRTTLDKSDYRYDNANGPAWGCAMATFCPDPCCGNVTTSTAPTIVKGEFLREDHPQCKTDAAFPCKGSISENAMCRVDFPRSTDFESMRANRLNVTCGCPKGFRWFTAAAMCFDVDECYELTHGCIEGRVCRNEDGKYRCDCPYDTIYDVSVQDCFRHQLLDEVLMERTERKMKAQQQKANMSTLQKSWLQIRRMLFHVFAVPDTSRAAGVTGRPVLIFVTAISSLVLFFL